MMAHGIWQSRLEAYAEGSLRWPLTWLVESHTRHCRECRQELRSQLAFLRSLDKALFTADEVVRTVACVTRREAEPAAWRARRTRRLSFALAGATALLVAVASLPIGLSGLFSPEMTVMAATSWSEGVATAVPIDDSHTSGTGMLIQSSVVSSGTGVAVPFRRD